MTETAESLFRNGPRSVSFTVFGSPVAQPKHQSRAFIGKDGKPKSHSFLAKTRKTATGREPAPIVQWRSDVKTAFIQAAGENWRLIEGPVRVDITWYFPRPKRLMRVKDPEGPVSHVAKPDRDNADKAILDSLNGVAWVDDSQVCGGELWKFYHEKNGRPRALIRIEEIVP